MPVLVDVDEDSTPTIEPRIAEFASWISLAVNVLLLLSKIVAFLLSDSQAVLASLVDSAVDLISQAVLAAAGSYSKTYSPNYPVGRSRLEALAVMACANVMIMVSLEVIKSAIEVLVEGFSEGPKLINLSSLAYGLMATTIVTKAALYIYCKWANRKQHSETLVALVEDHLNDVMSNSMAILTAGIASEYTSLWFMDAFGATVISCVIIYRWVIIILEWVRKIVGHAAPDEFVQEVENLCRRHDPRMSLDCTRIYYFGSRYLVEVEVVLPGDMPTWESHDIALDLQHKIESLDDVERAFVHVDHKLRDGLEHKVERDLQLRFRRKTHSIGSGSEEEMELHDIM
jgi:cation diffusion facilitator family transporter